MLGVLLFWHTKQGKADNPLREVSHLLKFFHPQKIFLRQHRFVLELHSAHYISFLVHLAT